MIDVTVRRATIDDVGAVGELFDQYRQFYGRAPDRDLAVEYLRTRLRHGESIVLVAGADGEEFVGFCHWGGNHTHTAPDEEHGHHKKHTGHAVSG